VTLRDLDSNEQVAKAKKLRHEDPITGELASHPLGAAVGAAIGGAATGALAGTVAGPLGTIAGTIIGGLAGALAGKEVAEAVDPTVESEYWMSQYQNRPYVAALAEYKQYEPAYRAGWESYSPDSKWEAIEPKAKRKWEENWESEGGAPSMTWEEAKQASQDAYDRIHAQRTAKEISKA
jgi:hypothetical protein